jgi:hypothetical protein
MINLVIRICLWQYCFVGNSLIYLTFNVSVTSELIQVTVSHGSSGITEQMPLIQILVPHVMGLKEQLKDSSKVRHLVPYSSWIFSICICQILLDHVLLNSVFMLVLVICLETNCTLSSNKT